MLNLQQVVEVSSKITMTNIIIMGKFEIFQEITKVWHRNTKSKCCGKNGTDTLAQCRFATKSSICKENAISAKCDKTIYQYIKIFF